MFLEVGLIVAVGILSVSFLFLRRIQHRKDESSVVWVIGASSGIGKGTIVLQIEMNRIGD